MTKRAELLERRETVLEAITAIMKTGQSYQIGTRKLTRANLSELQGWLDRIDQELAAQQNVAPFFDNAYQVYFEGR